MIDLVLQLELDKVIQLVSQLSYKDKEHLFQYLETELALDEDTRAIAYLERMGLIQPLPKEESEPPISDKEARELAARVGSAGPVSTLIIEERQEGY